MTDAWSAVAWAAEKRLTVKQQAILRYICDAITRIGYAPSIREIGDAVDLSSTDSVYKQLRTLERKGFIRRDSKRARTIVVLRPEPEQEPEVAAS